MANAPHHRDRRYVVQSLALRKLAASTRGAVCWRCGLTLDAHPLGANGKRQRWTAGHTVDSSTTWNLWTNVTRQPPPGDWLAPEASRCNMASSAERTNAMRNGYHAEL